MKKTVKFNIYQNGMLMAAQSVTAKSDSNFWTIAKEKIEEKQGFEVKLNPASKTASAV